MDDTVVALSVVLDLLGNLCSDCQSKARIAIARHQFRLNGKDGRDEIMRIVQAVCTEHSMPPEEVLAKSNRRSVVGVRREIAKLARARGFSFPQIGGALGKHHTTIINLLRK